MLRLCLLFEEIGFILFHFSKAPCLNETKPPEGNPYGGGAKQLSTYSRCYSIYYQHSTLRWTFYVEVLFRHRRQNACLRLLL